MGRTELPSFLFGDGYSHSGMICGCVVAQIYHTAYCHIAPELISQLGLSQTFDCGRPKTPIQLRRYNLAFSSYCDVRGCMAGVW